MCGIFGFLYGSAPPAALGLGGRAVVQPGNGAILAAEKKFLFTTRRQGGPCGIVRVGGRAVRDLSFLYGSASLGFGGRAVVQPGKGAIFAGWFRFKPDEPVREDNPARSLFVQFNPCAEQVLRPPAEIQARIRRCRVFGIPDLFVYPRADHERHGIWR